MSPPLPQLSGQQVVSRLKRAGFEHVSTRGSHAKLRDNAGRTVIVPLHRRPLARGTLASILRQAGLSADQLSTLTWPLPNGNEAYEEGFEDMQRGVPDTTRARELVGDALSCRVGDLDHVADSLPFWYRSDRAGGVSCVGSGLSVDFLGHAVDGTRYRDPHVRG